MSSPEKDKNYNLITVLQQALENTWQVDQYISDAEGDGDNDLAEWFRMVKANNQKAGEEGKKLLASRLST
jgi:uncharacterized protein YhfF